MKLSCTVLLIWGLIGNLVLFGQTRQLERPTASSANNQTSESRIALVIGNGAYTKTQPLPNPTNDATDMAATLQKLGFEVISGTNLDKREMETLIRQFGTKLAGGGVGLFYYAGHGVQVAGENYLIPVDANIPEEDEISYAAVSINLVLGKMAAARNDLNIVILDACRNNPFARSWRTSRDAGNNQGLARISPPTGTLVLYATEPGKRASDGSGRNGLFTESLLKQITVPGVEYEQMVRAVATDVWQRSNQQQLPWKEGISLKDFYFAAGDDKPKMQLSAVVNNTNPAAIEKEFWNSIKSSTDADDFHLYKERYPNGTYVKLADSNIKRLSRKNNKVSETQPKTPAISEAGGSTKAISLADQALNEWMRGNNQAAKKLSSEALKLNNNLPLAWAVSGTSKHSLSNKQEDDEAALKDLERAARLDPKNGFTQTRLTQLYPRLNQKELAEKAKNGALALLVSPTTAIDYYARGDSKNYLDNFDEKIADYTKAIELNPQLAVAYCRRGATYHNRWVTYKIRGSVYFRKTDIDAAIQDLSKAIEINPQFIWAYFQRSSAFRDKEDYDAAVRDYSKLIELDPPLAETYYYERGHVFRDKRDFDAAIRDFSKVIELNPKSVWAFSHRGRLYNLKNDYDAVIRDFSKVIELDPKNADAYGIRALTYEKLGQKSLAEADRQKLKELGYAVYE